MSDSELAAGGFDPCHTVDLREPAGPGDIAFAELQAAVQAYHDAIAETWVGSAD